MIEHRLVLEQAQKIIITQELRQAIALLTMPLLELQHFIEQQLQENPVLEQEYDKGDVVETISETESGEKKKEVDAREFLTNPAEAEQGYDWEKIAEDWQERPYAKSSAPAESTYQLTPVELQYSNLYEYVQFQLNIMSLPEEKNAVGSYIIANLSADGYLLMTPEDIARRLEVSLELVNDVLHLIRSFDPPGIGGVNLRQCLELQLDPSDSQYSQLSILIREHLDAIASNRLPFIAKKMKLSVQEVQELVDRIRELNPRPGQAIGGNEVVEYIYPDVVIEKVDDDYIVVVNDSTVPKVGINRFYLRLMKESSGASDEVKDYLKDKLNSAAWIIKGIEQRRATIYKIAEAVIELQKDFFDHGADHLVPLNLSAVAQRIGVHESTVSRAISNKYVQTPRGLYPWKFFFVNGVGSAGSLKATVTNVKNTLRELVNEEDPAHPLNDQTLVRLLEERDIYISRRTVAKYRKDLGIQCAGKRKRF